MCVRYFISQYGSGPLENKQMIGAVALVALLITAAALLVVAPGNSDDTADKRQAKISASDLMPSIETFPSGWTKGPEVTVTPPIDDQGITFLQVGYFNQSGNYLSVNIKVFDTVAEAKNAFSSMKQYVAASGPADYEDVFEQCFTYYSSPTADKVFVFQDKNVYGIVESWNMPGQLDANELKDILSNIEGKILAALE
jgi:hypothetical protein